jgi:hypothetical protein
VEPTRERLAVLVERGRAGDGFDPRTAEPDANVSGPVRRMPPWIRRVVVLSADASSCWLWCEADGAGGGPLTGQMVLDLPRGRYMIDVYDPADWACRARESAEGGPIVAGLPRIAEELLVHARAL